MLKSLKFKGVYKSDQDNILEDFYVPALELATSYDRAVGFFSASTISCAAQAISAFIKSNGQIRLILGAFSDSRDVDAINRGHDLRDHSKVIGRQFLDEMEKPDDELFQHRFEALAWLVAHNRLEIKIALRAHGMYHDKVGIITDSNADALIFSGSANESAQALLPTYNYESISVYPSWKPELNEYFKPHKDSFERLWSNRSPGTAVLDIPTAVREKLITISKGLTSPPDLQREISIARYMRAETPTVSAQLDTTPKVPSSINGAKFEVRVHQRDALNAWRVRGEFRGILDLATGAGKTITAAYAIVQMAKQIQGLTVVIAAPYQNLADQWCDVLERFNVRPIRCYVARSEWQEELRRSVHDIEMGTSTFAAIVVVNRTLQTPEFQDAIKRIPPRRFLWIGDECHHHQSQAFESSLPENAEYRLGLSATPEHYLDGERNDRLHKYYGDTVFSYTLKQAIEDKILTPYDYYPCVVEFSDEEAQEFIQLSNEISRMFTREKHKTSKPSQSLSALLMKRTRLIGAARNKIPALLEQIAKKKPSEHTLFYCGDGRVELTDEYDENDEKGVADSERQIDVVCKLLDLKGWRVSKFTSRESKADREEILANFKVGLTQALVAIRCLDEGIDVPACSAAYILASSRDPRQFIQRRGRILRRSAGKNQASIHDFVVVLPQHIQDENGHAKKLISSELQRVAEFAALSQNRTTAYETLRPYLQAYDLEHVL
jgi:superfamily II DNA or RNA helicase